MKSISSLPDETLRVLDDDAMTEVVGGDDRWGNHHHHHHHHHHYRYRRYHRYHRYRRHDWWGD